MNEKAFGADIERILDKWTEMVHSLGHVVDSESRLAGARAELANARKLLEAAEVALTTMCNETVCGEAGFAHTDAVDALDTAIADCLGDGEKPECLS